MLFALYNYLLYRYKHIMTETVNKLLINAESFKLKREDLTKLYTAHGDSNGIYKKNVKQFLIDLSQLYEIDTNTLLDPFE